VICAAIFVYAPVGSYFSLHIQRWDIAALIIPISLVALYGAVRLFDYGSIKIQKTSAMRFVLLVGYSVIFAIAEEMLFRGILQSFLFGIFGNLVATILASSMIFGIAHLLNGASGYAWKQLNWRLAGVTSVAGIFLGTVYAVTGSLVIPILLHCLLIVGNKLFVDETHPNTSEGISSRA